MGALVDKHQVRTKVWDALEQANAVTFPRPCHGRIPNFKGAAAACDRLARLPEFVSAKTVKVHPSLGASRLRELVLAHGKDLLTPPLPGHDFLYYFLSPSFVKPQQFRRAAEKRGFQQLGKRLGVGEIPPVDLVVVATVAVTPAGARVGKGKGYGEMEYAILRETGAITEQTPVATIAHDAQVLQLDELPCNIMEKHDLPVDIVCTPSRSFYTSTEVPKPTGVLWPIVTSQMMMDLGALKSLRENCFQSNPSQDNTEATGIERPKTMKICKAFIAGRSCANTPCFLAHSVHHLACDYKRKMCRTFKRCGNCSFGEYCMHKHGTDDRGIPKLWSSSEDHYGET